MLCAKHVYEHDLTSLSTYSRPRTPTTDSHHCCRKIPPNHPPHYARTTFFFGIVDTAVARARPHVYKRFSFQYTRHSDGLFNSENLISCTDRHRMYMTITLKHKHCSGNWALHLLWVFELTEKSKTRTHARSLRCNCWQLEFLRYCAVLWSFREIRSGTIIRVSKHTELCLAKCVRFSQDYGIHIYSI